MTFDEKSNRNQNKIKNHLHQNLLSKKLHNFVINSSKRCR